jgi:hypothetical protein
MSEASVGGMDAARVNQYRHPLVRLMIPLMVPLSSVGARAWSPAALALGAVLMSWDPAPTLAQRFESALATLDRALPRRRRVGRTYQGFIKALARHGRATLAALTGHLRLLSRRAAGAEWTVGGLVPIGVDGSKFNAPRTISNERLGFAGRDKCPPQMIALLMVHLGSMLPWAWRAAPVRRAERVLLRRMLGVLPEQTLLVADAGFTGYDLLCELRRRGVHFLVRVGRSVNLLTELGYYRREGKSTVYLWPNDQRDRAPLVLRLVRVGSAYLITDVTDPKRLSRKHAAELYRRRWGLEVAFRSLKQTLEHRAVRSGAARHARRELDWAIAGLWMLALLGVRAIRAAGAGPRRLSLAATLAAVRHAAHAHTTERSLRRRLRRAVLDSYKREGSRKAHRFPRKKQPPSPGDPRITTATPAQVAQARGLRRSNKAA